MKVENEEALRRFNSDWDAVHSTKDTQPPIDPGKGSESGGIMDSIAASNVNPTTHVPAPIPTTGDRCGQCNLLHPPVRPGETCPNAQNNTPVPEAPQPLTEGSTLEKVKATSSPPAPQPTPATPTPTINTSEPSPLADNNIPTEIHVNKYLASWGDMIQAHCMSHSVENVKKLMRHITIEITDFLETYKGK
jgi:hypothetical protein